jgi:hypothetical protein
MVQANKLLEQENVDKVFIGKDEYLPQCVEML